MQADNHTDLLWSYGFPLPVLHVCINQDLGLALWVNATRHLYTRHVATGWTSSSPVVRSPGLRFRRIVYVFGVGDVRR